MLTCSSWLRNPIPAAACTLALEFMPDCFPFAFELEFTAFCILDVTSITMLMPVCGVAYVLRIRLQSSLLLDCLPAFSLSPIAVHVSPQGSCTLTGSSPDETALTARVKSLLEF